MEWEEGLDKEWDAAVRNNSALQEAITQMLYDEAAIRAGKTVIEIYLDIKKFYDHISWYKLLWHAASQHFPLPPLLVGAYIHLGPRTLRLRQMYSDVRSPVYGVIAGDNNANPFAKSIIYYLMNRIARAHEDVVLKGYVDSISESTREADTDKAIRVAVEAAIDTRDQLASLGLIVGESAILVRSQPVELFLAIIIFFLAQADMNAALSIGEKFLSQFEDAVKRKLIVPSTNVHNAYLSLIHI